MSEQKTLPCEHCGAPNRLWITTCPACGTSKRNSDLDVSLAGEPAPTLSPTEQWIDLPISAEEPVRVALFVHFLNERSMDFSESRRFVSVRTEDAPRLLRDVVPWAFHHDLPPDPRLHDSLALTMRSIGIAVLEGIERSTSLPIAWPEGVVREGVDLR